MDTFFEIKALPNSEIIQSDIIAVLMQKLHLMLLGSDGRIAIDFPAYGQGGTLGGIIRLLGVKLDVEKLYSQVCDITLFADYALIENIKEIPPNVEKYIRNKRYHTGGGNSRTKRMEKRHKANGTWTPELANAIREHYNKTVEIPHLNFKSLSSNQTFKLFILSSNTSEFLKGKFNSYGLSVDNASIPKF
jgi:CRISPR-associated endonuclease Csy4